MPDGVSTATFSFWGKELWRGSVANPYALDDALKQSGVPSRTVNTLGWPAALTQGAGAAGGTSTGGADSGKKDAKVRQEQEQ